MSTALVISIISAAVLYATSVLYATIGEIFSQRAGIMNLGLEGIMLMGAVSGYMVAVDRQNLGLAILTVLIVGGALGLVFAFLTVTLQADQTVAGMAMLTFGTGLSGFIGKDYCGVNANLKFEPFDIPLLSDIPVIGEALFHQDILVYAMYIIVPVSLIFIYGLRDVYVILGCAMTAVSGACLSLSYTNFWSDGMTSGKGWIAVALVVFASWHPMTAVLGALLFGAISIIGIDIQMYYTAIPSQFYSALPYVATMIALIFTTGNFRKKRSAAPAALCIPYDREER